jgi:hyaluronate lyase
MFNNAVVALGSGITDPDAVAISTTVENRKLKSDNSNVFSYNGTAQANTLTAGTNLHNVTSLHLTGNVTGSDIGYVFYDPALTITYAREANTGSDSQIETTGSTTTVTNNFLSFFIGHGTAPVKQKYSYAILPGMTAAQTATYAAAPDVFIIRNDDSVQAVKQNTTNTIGVNFWRDATDSINIGTHAGFILTNHPASVMVHQTSTQIEIAVSDPTQAYTGIIYVKVKVGATSIISHDANLTTHAFGATVPTELNFNANGLRGKTQRIILSTVGGGSLNSMAIADTAKIDKPLAPVDTVKIDKPFETILYPNPTTGSFRLAYYSTADQKGQITIYDANGIVKQSKSVQLLKGKNDIGVDVSLTKGIYYVVFVNAKETVKKQLIIN